MENDAGRDAAVQSSYLRPLQHRKRLVSADSATREAADENLAQPPLAKRRLSSNGNSNGARSSGHCDGEIVPHSSSPKANTEINTQWALRNFSAWQKRRNAQYPTEKEMQVPSDILTSCDPKLLNKWMALYASETRKQEGGMFSPKTIYLLLAGLFRHMRSLNPTCPNFLHPSNLPFKPLHDSLQNTFRELQANNIIPETKSAEPFSREEEERLWSSGALSTDTPKGLLRAVFFLNGRNFGLVSGDKHRLLKLSQIKRVANPPRYVYTTDDTTEEAGGLAMIWKKKNMKEKAIFVDAAVEKGNRCHVHVLDLYLQKIPPEAFEKDNFYLQPVKNPIKQWFSLQPVGINCLSRMVREICTVAGIDGVKTNLSLRASGATCQAELHDNESASSSSLLSTHKSPLSQVQSADATLQPALFLDTSTGQPLLVQAAVQGTDTPPNPTFLQGPVQTDTATSAASQPLFFFVPVQSKVSAQQVPTLDRQCTTDQQSTTTSQQQVIPPPTMSKQVTNTTPIQHPPAIQQEAVSHSPPCTYTSANQHPQPSPSQTSAVPVSAHSTTTQHSTIPHSAPSTTNAQQYTTLMDSVAQQPIVSQFSPQSHNVSSAQGPMNLQFPPQQLIFDNCHVSIVVTPYPSHAT